MPMYVDRFERFFRTAAGLDVDKSDLRRLGDVLDEEIYNLLLRAEANAGANGRDVVQPWDLPLTKGLQELMHEFRRLDHDIDLQPVLDQLAARPPLTLACADETLARLPEVAGGISLGVARVITIIDPEVKNPATEHWDRVFRIVEQLL
jgi:hypothetical protein